jgi:hypothetical protein
MDITNDHAAQGKLFAGSARKSTVLFRQQLRHAAADRAATEQRNAE